MSVKNDEKSGLVGFISSKLNYDKCPEGILDYDILVT